MSAIQFPMQYNANLLVEELNIALQHQWSNHFNKNDFDGDWKVISLKSTTGDTNDIIPKPIESDYKNTALLEKLPYINSILNEWKCEKEAVRLLALYPGSEIKPHTDKGCSYQDGSFRVHIPITTNPNVYFFVSDINYKLMPGSCWYMDFSEVHCVRNLGQTTRVHLVIDAKRNDWTDELFYANGYQDPVNEMSVAEAKLIIAQLETHQTEVAQNLINQLKATHGL